MSDLPVLTILLAIPLIGAVLLALAPARTSSAAVKVTGLGVSLLTLAFGVAIALNYEPDAGMQFVETHRWIGAFGAHYALGLDGIGLGLVLLTLILTPVVMLASWEDAEDGRWSAKAFVAWMLALEALSLGVFLATDVFLFYVLFEATLIPIYFMISGWGGADRARAALKFLLYSLLGGLIMLASVIGIYVVSASDLGAPSYLLADLAGLEFGQTAGRWMFIGFFIAFAIKAPMVPVHTWLPDATEEATPGTSVLLVSVLDKIGTFGMIRFGLELFPEASAWATPVVVILAVISIIYGAFMAIGAENISRLIAHTSVSHFGFMVLGIFVMNAQGLSGATLYMFNHGLSTAALFLVTGFLITRRGSAQIADFGGVEKVAPVLAGIFLLAGLSSLSLPGLAPFVSEFLVTVGAWAYHPAVAAVSVTAIVLAAIYILWMYQRTMTGPTNADTAGMVDLNVREVTALAPLVVLIIVVGFFPQPLLNAINPAVDTTLSIVESTSEPAELAGIVEGSQK